MKKIKQILVIAFISITVFSCNRDKIETDGFFNNSRANTIFFSDDSGVLFVEDGAQNEINIVIGATAVVDSGISYEITVDPASTAIEGVDFEISNTASFPNGNIVTAVKVIGDFDNSTTDGKTVILKLASNTTLVSNDDTYTLELVKFCPLDSLTTTNYTADVFAFDDIAPTHDVTLVPVLGTTNQWTITSSWGPEFVAWATGDPGFSGQFLYSGTLVVNDDFTLDYIGNDAWASGGSGNFSPCTQEFSMTLTQGLFTNPFTVDVVLSPN